MVRALLCIAAIIAATFLLYLPSWQNPFVFDDMAKIEENTDLRAPFKLRNFIYPYSEINTHVRNDPSRPLTFIAYWVCWQVGGGQVWPFHLLSTAAHAAAAVLLALLTVQLGFLTYNVKSWTAGAIGAGLFLTSPLIAGTVVYPYGLSDVLCAVFTMAMLVLLIEMQTVTRLRMIIAVTFYFLALLSKQAGFVAPALLIAMDYFTGKGNTPWRKLHIYTPLLSMSVIYICIRYLYFGGIGDLEGLNETLPWHEYLPLQGPMILKYLAHTLVPLRLTIDHQPFPDDIPIWLRILSWLLITSLTAYAMTARWSRMKKIKLLSLGWIFFLICMLPTSSILPTVDLFVERRAYFANLGFYMAAGVLLWQIALHPKWKWLVLGGTAIAAGAQAAVTLGRVHVYSNPEALWQESLALYPGNSRALINLGVEYSRSERWEEARRVFEELLKLRPENGSVYTKLAYIYHQKNYSARNDQLAWELYLKGLKMMPENIFGQYNAGVFLMDLGRNAEAVAYFLRAAQLAPKMTEAWTAAGQAAMNAGDKTSAKKYLKQALAIDSSLAKPDALLKELDRNETRP